MVKRVIVRFSKRFRILLMKLPPLIFKFPFDYFFCLFSFFLCAFLEVKMKRMIPAHSVRLMRRLYRKERSKERKRVGKIEKRKEVYRQEWIEMEQIDGAPD